MSICVVRAAAFDSPPSQYRRDKGSASKIAADALSLHGKNSDPEMELLLDFPQYVMKPGALLAAVVALSLMVRLFLRGRHIRRCKSCGARKVRSTRPSGIFDRVAGWFFIRPHRCEGCRERFYAFRWNTLHARRRRVIWVVFQFRDRSLARIVIRRVLLRPNLRSLRHRYSELLET